MSVPVAIPSEAFESLRHRLVGEVALPHEPRYIELATPFNVAVRSNPVAVVDARSAEDVAEAVRFAGSIGLPVAVQATGHGIAEPLDGALLIHTSGLDECVVHPEGWARVGAGARWHQVISQTEGTGWAALCGSSVTVGVVGYTTGGGIGPLSRTYGYACDLVRAFEVVTGDGVRRRATVQDEPDLYWGLRGGKAALGIVTAMEFDLVPLTQFYGGALYFDGADAASVLHAWREWSANLPVEATTSVALMQLPAVPGVPEPLAGRLTVAVRFVWTGEPEAADAVLAPIRAAGSVVLGGIGVLPFSAIASVHNDPTDPMPVHEATDLLSALPTEAVDALLAVAGPGSGSPQVIVELRQLGGALARPAKVPDALCHRSAAFNLSVIGVSVPPIADAVATHAESVRAAIAPWATGGALPNFGAGTGTERLRRCYDEATLARLIDVASVYDPGNVLRRGQVPVRPA